MSKCGRIEGRPTFCKIDVADAVRPVVRPFVDSHLSCFFQVDQEMTSEDAKKRRTPGCVQDSGCKGIANKDGILHDLQDGTENHTAIYSEVRIKKIKDNLTHKPKYNT